MKRWRYVVIALLALITTLYFLLYWLFTSQDGLQWIYQRLHQWMPALSIERVEGHLNQQIILHNIKWHNASNTQTLSIKTFKLKWQARDLLRGTLKIENIFSDGIHWKNTQSSTVNANQPINLNLDLPIKLQIDHIELQQLALQDDNEEPTYIHQIILDTQRINSNEVAINSLLLENKPYTLSAHGTLQYNPLNMQLKLALREQQTTLLNSDIQIQKVDQQYQLLATLLDPLNGNIQASMMQENNKLHWKLLANVNSKHYRLPDDTLIGLKANISAQGNQSRIDAKGHLTLNTIDIAERPNQQLEFTFLGQKQAKQWHGTLESHWHYLAWPLTPFPDYTSQDGQLTLSGNLANYHLQLNTKIGGYLLPDGEWKIQAEGSKKNVHITELTAKTLEGTVSGTAKFAWQPTFSGIVQLTGKHINPAKHWYAWPGNISFQLTSQWQQKKSGLQIDLDIPQADGHIRQQKLSAKLSAQWDNDYLQRLQTQTDWGDAKANIDLKTQKNHYQGQWNISIPNFNRLIPWASGKIDSQGTIQGKIITPDIQTKTSIKRFSWDESSVEQLEANGHINFNTQHNSNFKLLAKNINIAPYNFKQVTINVKQQSKQQHILLQLDDDYQLILEAKGQYHKPSWQGSIERLDLHLANNERWHLQQAFPINWSNDHLQLNPFCWQSRQQSVCGQLNWRNQKNSKIKVTIKNLRLQPFIKLLDNNTILTSHLNLQSDLKFNPLDGWRGQLNSQINAGKLSYRSTTGNQYHYQLANNRLSFIADKTGMVLNWRWPSTHHGKDLLNFKLNLPNYHGIGPLTSQQKISGSLSAHWQQLSMLGLILPELDDIQGQLNLTSHWDGNLKQPNLQGQLKIGKLSAITTYYGLNLQNGSLDVSTQAGKAINYLFQIQSGQGILHSQGYLNPWLDDWPAKLTIKGDHVTVMNTHNISIIVSPDLQVEHNKQHTLLKGTLVIPKANIYYQDYDAVVQLPSETVFVSEQNQQTKPWLEQLYADINLKLGDDVHLNTDELNARLAGEVKLSQNPKQPATAQGELSIVDGHYSAYGQQLTIEKSRLIYTHTPVTNPGLDIRAIKNIKTMMTSTSTLTHSSTQSQQNLTVGILIQGNLNDPKVILFSDPASLDQSNILSYLILDQPINDAGRNDIQTIWQAANLLQLGHTSLASINKTLRSTFGLDELTLSSSSQRTNTLQDNTALVLGKMLTPEFFINYSIGLVRPINTFSARYQFNHNWSVQTEVNSLGQGVDILYSFSID